MSPEDFQVVIVDDGTDPETRNGLEHLARNRTNVEIIDVEVDGSPVDAGVARAEGRYVLILEDASTLAPHALDRLCEHADATAADICFAKTSRRGRRIAVPAALSTTSARVPVHEAALATSHGRLYRRSFLHDSGLRVDGGTLADLHLAALQQTQAVAVLADVQAVTLPPSSESPPAEWTARAETVRWSGGSLRLDVLLAGEGVATSVPEVQGCVFRLADGLEWTGPPAVVTGAAGQGVRVDLVVDPSTLAAGRSLAPGQWRPALLVSGEAGTERVPIGVSGRVRKTSFHGGRGYVTYRASGVLGLDVGAVSHPVVPRLEGATASVREDARGSLLTARAPDLEMLDETAEGQLLVGRLPVRAWLRTGEDGTATLHAFVSGFAGRYPLSTKFSSAKPAPAGLQLVIDPAGTMRTARSPRDEQRSVTRTATKQPNSPVRRIAKSLPGAAPAYRRLRAWVQRPR